MDVLQPTHLIFILVIALLVLGPKRLPEVGRALGKGMRDFRGALSGEEDAGAPKHDPEASSDADLSPVTPATTALPPEDTDHIPAAYGGSAPAPTPVPAPSSETSAAAPHASAEDAKESSPAVPSPEPVAPAPDSAPPSS